ncbi:MAG: AMP-binding protein [Clostridia bacterium]|nr:AMP-binding protein [Clostridia bacterium]
MRITNIGGARSVNEYVKRKLELFEAQEKSFETLFGLMFSEAGNVMTEKAEGFKIIKTTYGEAKENILLISKAMEKSMPAMLSSDAPVCGIYMENSLLWIEIFWALVVSGVRPLLMNLLLDKRTLKKAALDAGCSFIICDASKEEELSEDFSDICVKRAEELDLGKELFRDSSKNDQENAGEGKRRFAQEIIFMTSGTTENVKLCFYGPDRFFHQISYSYSIIRKNRQAKKHYEGELKQLAFLPFYHIFGFVAVYLWFGFFSRTFVFLGDLSPDTLTNTVRRRHVTHIFAVPLFWNKVYEGAMRKITAMGPETAARFEKGLKIADILYKIPLIGNSLGKLFSRAAFRPVRRKLFGESVYFGISGGGQIRNDVIRFFNLIGYRLVNGFGMTETAITSVELSNSISRIMKGCVGYPLDKVSYRIENGELYVKGPVLAGHVLENGVDKKLPEWFPTKDMAEKTNAGYRILGRADDLIVPESGENINPDIAERSLLLPGIVNVCVLRHKGGAAVVAEVSPDSGPERIAKVRSDIAAEVLKTNLRGNVTDIIIVNETLIPQGDFKVSRKKLAARLESGELKDAGRSGEQDSAKLRKDGCNADETEKGITGKGSIEDDRILREIIGVIAECKGTDESSVDPDADLFADLGINSLDYFQIISAVSKKYGVSLPVGFSGAPATPASLRNKVEEIIGKEGGAVK